jgi:hypothetical protein
MKKVAPAVMIMSVSLLAAAGESNSPSVLPYDGMPTTCRDAVQHSLEDYFRIQSGEQEVFAEIEYVFLDHHGVKMIGIPAIAFGPEWPIGMPRNIEPAPHTW